jgi:hypothetical protein
MDSSSLSSILSDEPSDTGEVTEQPVETQAPQVEEPKAEDTGEVTGAPPEPQKEDNLEKARKGLEAAAKAERERRQAAEARAEAAERRAQALEQQYRQPPQPPQQQQPDADPKPARAQFESEDDWLDARDAWRDRRREREATIQKAQREAEDMYVKTESIYAQAQALEGFNRAAFDALPLTKPMVEALIDSDHAPALMQFMSANPAEVARIGELPTARQIKEIARIEDRLSAAPKVEPTPKEKPVLPETLTQARNAKGQYEPAYSGPTPLDAVLATK